MKRRNFFRTGSVIIICALFSVCVFAESRMKAGEFPERTIIIGTHAIYLDVITEELLEIAEKSVKDSGQDRIYYKSDINKGTWYDITNSSEISQISVSQDNIVPNQKIEEVPLTHYTNKEGTTISFENGKAISAASLLDKSNPRSMQQMQEIVQEREIQSELLENKGGSVYRQKIDSIDKVLKPIETENLNTFNQALETMERAVAAIQRNKEAAQENAALAVREKVKLEKEKDVYCYQTVYNRMDEETRKLDYEKCGDLIDKYANAMGQLKAAIAETGIQSEEEGKEETGYPDALSAQEEQFSKQVLEAAKSGDANKVLEAAENLTVLDSVRKNNTDVSPEQQKKQMTVLQQIRGGAMSALRQAQQEVSQSASLSEAMRDGSSQAAIAKVKADLADSVKMAAKNLTDIDNRILQRQKNADEKDALLAQTETLLQDIEKGIPLVLQDSVSAALQDVKEALDSQRKEIQLEALPEYQNLKKALFEQEETVKKLYEEYMDAAEKNDMPLANAVKKKLEGASEQKNKCSMVMEKMEKAVQSGALAIAFSQDTETKGKPEVLKAQEGLLEEAEALLTELAVLEDKETESIGENGKEKIETEASEEESGDTRYTVEEREALKKAVSRISQQGQDGTYLPPWRLVFQDYMVKLTAPLYQLGKEIYVPAEELAYQLGAQVIKNQKNQAVIIRKGSNLIEFIPNDMTVYVNDKETLIKPAPSVFFEGRFYLPLSCFEQAFGFVSAIEGETIYVSKK